MAAGKSSQHCGRGHIEDSTRFLRRMPVRVRTCTAADLLPQVRVIVRDAGRGCFAAAPLDAGLSRPPAAPRPPQPARQGRHRDAAGARRLSGRPLPASLRARAPASAPMKRLLTLLAVLRRGRGPARCGDGTWQVDGTGKAYSKATSVGAGNVPTTSVTGRNVTVNWSASSVSGGPAATGYVVKRYNGAGAQQTIGSGCSGTISDQLHRERRPARQLALLGHPRYQGWTGAESAQSTAATVGSPSLSFSRRP